MRASRLLTILITLQLRGRVTAQALADTLEVSKRTIYRDMDELSAAGVPVYAERGPEGGFALLDGFRTQLTGLTASETEALMLAGLPAAAADLGLSRAAGDAQLKMLASLPAESRHSAERVSRRFHLDLVDWYRRVTPPDHLSDVAKAVWESRRIDFNYESWARRARSRVDPLGLVLKAGRWYLVARRGGKIRNFRLDKVLDVTISDETFDFPPDFDLAATWRALVTSFEAGLKRGMATLRAAPSMIDHLDELGADIAEPLRAAAPQEDGWHQAAVPVEGLSHTAAQLLRFGDDIEVVEPEELRQELRHKAAAVLRLYRSKR